MQDLRRAGVSIRPDDVKSFEPTSDDSLLTRLHGTPLEWTEGKLGVITVRDPIGCERIAAFELLP